MIAEDAYEFGIKRAIEKSKEFLKEPKDLLWCLDNLESLIGDAGLSKSLLKK